MSFIGRQNFRKYETDNLVLHKGAAFPTSPAVGQLFYSTTAELPYVYTVDGWKPIIGGATGADLNAGVVIEWQDATHTVVKSGAIEVAGELLVNTSDIVLDIEDAADWLSVPVPSSRLLNLSPVAWWPLNEASGDAIDTSGNGYDFSQTGTIGAVSVGGITNSTWSTGREGDSGEWFGPEPITNVPNIDAVMGAGSSSQYTILGRSKTDNPSGSSRSHGLFSVNDTTSLQPFGDGTATKWIQLYVHEGYALKFSFREVAAGSLESITTPLNIVDDTKEWDWACTVDIPAGRVKIYLNGQLVVDDNTVNTAVYPTNLTGCNCYMSASTTGGSPGQQVGNDIMICPGILTDEEIMLYTQVGKLPAYVYVAKDGTNYTAKLSTTPPDRSDAEVTVVNDRELRYKEFASNWYRNVGSIIIDNGVLDPNLLLLHCDGTPGSFVFPDSSNYSRTVTNINNVEVVAAPAVFSQSGQFGNNKYLEIDSSSDFDFWYGDFTVDFRVYMTSVAANQPFIGYYMLGSPWGDDSGWINIHYSLGDGVLRVGLRDDPTADGWGVMTNYDYPWVPATSTWYHIAVTRNNGNLYVFIDGVQQGTTATSNEAIRMRTLYDYHLTIGAKEHVYELNGYVDEVRVASIAAWTSNFTPPAAPYPTVTPSGRIFPFYLGANTEGYRYYCFRDDWVRMMDDRMTANAWTELPFTFLPQTAKIAMLRLFAFNSTTPVTDGGIIFRPKGSNMSTTVATNSQKSYLSNSARGINFSPIILSSDNIAEYYANAEVEDILVQCFGYYEDI